MTDTVNCVALVSTAVCPCYTASAGESQLNIEMNLLKLGLDPAVFPAAESDTVAIRLGYMTPKKILVVEDDKVTQKMISGALESAGYQVLTAEDAVTAMGIIRTEDPDLVTLDINLEILSPGDAWDGFTFAHWLRRLNEGQEGKPKPVVVVLSGLEPEKILRKAAEIGAHTFLPKPFEKQKLLSIVAEALKS